MKRIDIQKLVESSKPQNAVDRVIETVAPGWGVRRRRTRFQLAMMDGYHGASSTRRQSAEFHAPKSNPDEELEWQRDTLQARSHDMHRNSSVARGIYGTLVTSVIGTGLRMKPVINEAALGLTREQAATHEKALEAEFYPWAESTFCDLSRDTNIYGLQALAFRAFLVGGDSFALLPMVERPGMPYRTCVQIIEAERVSNPDYKMDDDRLRGGIEFDERGVAATIHVSSKHPYAIRDKTIAWQPYKVFSSTGRRNVLQIYERLWPGQSRGEPLLAPILEPLRMLEKYTEAELMAAVISAMLTVFVKTEAPAQGFGPMDGMPEAKDDPRSRDPSRDGFKLGSGAILDLATGEDVVVVDPKRPNTGYDQFFQSILREVGMALEIPYEILIKHFTASYSAARAAMLEAWRAFTTRRQWFAARFCQPIYEAFVEEGVLLGRIALPGFVGADQLVRQAWLGAEWTGPGRGQIDELKEAQAADFRIKANLSTRALEVPNLTGRDWEDVAKQRQRENEFDKELGIQAPEEKALEEGGENGAVPGKKNGATPGTDKETGDREDQPTRGE